jgi:hypothetical protein
MSLGYTITKADIDLKAAGLVVTLRDSLQRCNDFCALLNNTNKVPNDAFLTGLGYTSGEVTSLRAAFTDLGGASGSSLYRLAHGQATLGGANDYFFNAQLLTGVLLT